MKTITVTDATAKRVKHMLKERRDLLEAQMGRLTENDEASLWDITAEAIDEIDVLIHQIEEA